MGKKQYTQEAVFFLRLNEWVLAESGGSWDYPEPLTKILEDPDLENMFVSELQRSLTHPLLISYLGLGGYLCKRGVSNLQFPWGWKDPRNVFTLPLWLRLFPDARVIYIERHGVDVAASLRTRAISSFSQYEKNQGWMDAYNHALTRRKLFWHSPRCLDLEGGFELWQTYARRANYSLEIPPKENVLTVRYETFLSESYSVLEEVADFCRLSVSSDLLKSAASDINSNRAFAYHLDTELSEFAQSKKEELKEFDY